MDSEDDEYIRLNWTVEGPTCSKCGKAAKIKSATYKFDNGASTLDFSAHCSCGADINIYDHDILKDLVIRVAKLEQRNTE